MKIASKYLRRVAPPSTGVALTHNTVGAPSFAVFAKGGIVRRSSHHI